MIGNLVCCSSPLPDTIDHGVAFTQERECTSQDSRTSQARQYNQRLDQYRPIGQPVVEDRQISATEAQESVGTKINAGLVIMNAVPGVSGIYQIQDKNTGNTFNAYVNMTDDGGNWVLALHWSDPSSVTRQMKDLAVKGRPISSYTANPAYPVIPSGVINASSHGLLKSANAGWISAYGSWQSFPLFEPGFQITSAGFQAKNPAGNVTLYNHGNGWNIIGVETSNFGLWTEYGNGGPCGGANRQGTTKICPSTNFSNWTSHVESDANKSFYLKGVSL